MVTAALITALAATAMAGWVLRTRRNAVLGGRVAEPARWQQLYPASDLPTVMPALYIICEAFLLPGSDVFRLQPEDRLDVFYRAAYPQGGADTMEFEHLSLALSRTFNVPTCELERLNTRTVSDILILCISHARNVA